MICLSVAGYACMSLDHAAFFSAGVIRSDAYLGLRGRKSIGHLLPPFKDKIDGVIYPVYKRKIEGVLYSGF